MVNEKAAERMFPFLSSVPFSYLEEMISFTSASGFSAISAICSRDKPFWYIFKIYMASRSTSTSLLVRSLIPWLKLHIAFTPSLIVPVVGMSYSFSILYPTILPRAIYSSNLIEEYCAPMEFWALFFPPRGLQILLFFIQ